MRPRQLPFLLALLWICPTYARDISVGFIAGLPVTNLLEAREGTVSKTGRYTFGPDLRIGLLHDFAVDINLLYKTAEFGFQSDPARAAIRRLEFPVQLRYRLPGPGLRPWIEVGMSFNRVMSVAGSDPCGPPGLDERFYCLSGVPAIEMRHRSTHGPVLGAGVEFRKNRLQLDTEIRVTRWVDRNFGTRESPLQSNLTQIEVLVAVRF
ncbi:MAG: hypothetical protein WAO20_13290 [Acidobacteriota bacterium]